MSSLPKVFVIQRGARHRYAVPRLLYSNHCLTGVFTDSHAGSFLGRLASALSRCKVLPKNLSRLSQRRIYGVPESLVSSTDRWLLHGVRLGKLATENTTAWLQYRDKVWLNLSKGYLPRNANVLYVMGGENLGLLELAKRNRFKIIVDAFIHPLNLRQTGAAKQDLGLPLMQDELEYYDVESHYQAVFRHADIILCPSHWVAEGVSELSPEQAHKIRICPYGSSIPPSEMRRAPVPGRIFWAGGDWFRKGLHHLAAAALALREYPEMEFRIAGITDPAITSMPQFRNLHFLGKLDRAGMQEEYSKADLFVFPTLTEGMASVLVEAVTAGCPVLTTKGAGFDGLEESGAGRIFEAGDTSALASLMLDLTRDRAAVHAMNAACARFAPNFTEEAWAKRLIPILQELKNS